MNKKVSIVFGHFSETKERDALTIRSIESLQQFRSSTTELIVSANGRYGDIFKKYCDKYIERDADLSSGRTTNLGFDAAEGDVFFLTANDQVFYPGAVEQCVEIVTKYPKYLATPIYPHIRRRHELPPVDGYAVNYRVGSGCMCLTREQFNDLGRFDEKMIYFDMLNYINKWIAKGYAVMMTKERLGRDIGQGKTSSFAGQAERNNIELWKKRQPIYDTTNLDFTRKNFNE